MQCWHHFSLSYLIRLLFLIILFSGSWIAAQEQVKADEISEHSEAHDVWLKIGSFQGGYQSQWQDVINNEIFKEYQRGSFYRELGKLNIQVPVHMGDAKAALKAEYQRRIYTSQEPKFEGEMISRKDLSGYRIFNGAITKATFKLDYANNLIHSLDVGVEIEAGYSMAISKYQGSNVNFDDPLDRVNRGPFKEEFKKFWDHNGIHANRRILKDLGKGMIGVVDLIVGGVTRPFIDREKSAFFVENYVEPMQLYADLGLPLNPDVFNLDTGLLHPGDMLNYNVFIGFAPLAANFKKLGITASYKKFARYIRETTFLVEEDGFLRVHIGNVFLSGDERIPFKIRPEVSLLFFRLSHTFVNNQYDHFQHTTGEIEYRLNLKTEEGRARLRELIRLGRLVTKPCLEEVCEDIGVEVNYSEFRKGEKQENTNFWRFLNLFRYENEDLSSRQEIKSYGRYFQEAKRLRVREMRNRTFPRKDQGMSCLVTFLNELPHEESLNPYPKQTTMKVQVSLEDRMANQESLERLTRALLRVISSKETQSILVGLEPSRKVGDVLGIEMGLDLFFTQEQVRRIQSMKLSWLWQEVAAYYLGDGHRDDWQTAAKRRAWLFKERAKGNPRRFGHPGRRSFLTAKNRHYDSAPGFVTREVGSPDVFLERAEKTVKRLKELGKIHEVGDYLGEPLAPFEDFRDLALVLSLLVKAGEGPYDDSIGHRVEIFADGMARPHIAINEAYPDFQERERIDLDIENIVDSGPRLKAGQVFLLTGRLREPMMPGRPSPLRLEIYSDYLFEQGMMLRVNVREAKLSSDNSLHIKLVPMPDPELVDEGPFKIAKYRYVFETPWTKGMELGATFNIELRVLNQDGRPVTEEHLLKFRLPSKKGLEKLGFQGAD